MCDVYSVQISHSHKTRQPNTKCTDIRCTPPPGSPAAASASLITHLPRGAAGRRNQAAKQKCLKPPCSSANPNQQRKSKSLYSGKAKQVLGGPTAPNILTFVLALQLMLCAYGRARFPTVSSLLRVCGAGACMLRHACGGAHGFSQWHCSALHHEAPIQGRWDGGSSSLGTGQTPALTSASTEFGADTSPQCCRCCTNMFRSYIYIV